MDRLTEIEERWANPADKDTQPHVDIAWLIAEVKRLRGALGELLDIYVDGDPGEGHPDYAVYKRAREAMSA